MTLKTLKDFKDIDCYIEFVPSSDGELIKRRHIPESELRQMAIDWIKKLQKGSIIMEEKEMQSYSFKLEGAIWILKRVFNISEEDIKH